MTTSDNAHISSLVVRSRKGDRTALDALINAIQPGIFTLAQRFLMIPADAEDACQEILLKIITRLGQFDNQSQFKTWAYAVARNHLLDLKRRPFEQAMSLDEFAEDLVQGQQEMRLNSPDELLMLEEVRIACTLAMLQCLDREARLSYILGEILELDHAQAAEVLGINSGAYRKRLSRARSTITSFMQSHCGLANPENSCRCRKRVKQAQTLGRIDPANLMFSSSTVQAKQFPEVLHTIRELKQNQRAAALYRAQQQPVVSSDFTNWLKTTLKYHELET